jgi:uncharacterized protein (TIGR02118 family)
MPGTLDLTYRQLPMVVLVALLPRKPGMSKEDFHRHWRERHGPLVVETLGSYLKSYEQYHRLPDGMGSGDEWDGIAIQRYESEEAFTAFLSDPAYAEKINPDEQEFMDVGKVVWFIAEPPEILI